MIDRMVLMKFKEDYANAETRNEAAERSRKDLRDIPGVLKVTVGVPADASTETSWDLSLILSFESVEAIAEYIVHPAHRAYVDNYLKPRLEILKAWNFDSTSVQRMG